MCAHRGARAHICTNTHDATSSRLISLPIVTPPVCHQPFESITSDKCVRLRGSLSISISPPQHLLFFHTIQYPSLSHHPHTTLSCQQIASVSKLLKYPAPLCSSPFSALLSNYFYVLLKSADFPACSNLPLTPLFSLYLTFV